MNRIQISTVVRVSALWALGAGAVVHAADPCSLLTPVRISAAVGVNVAPGTAIGSTGCDWEGPAGSRVRVTIALWPGTGWEKMKTPLPDTIKTAISGLGDDAFYAVMGPFTSLSVKKGDTAFILRVYGIKDSYQQLTIEKSLAASAVKEL
jgi:hypothetical protein